MERSMGLAKKCTPEQDSKFKVTLKKDSIKILTKSIKSDKSNNKSSPKDHNNSKLI